MFATIDAFVLWFSKQPIALYLVGFVGAQVFMCIFDALLTPRDYDNDTQFEESEDSDND